MGIDIGNASFIENKKKSFHFIYLYLHFKQNDNFKLKYLQNIEKWKEVLPKSQKACQKCTP